MTMLRTLDELSPVSPAEDLLSSHTNTIALIVILALLVSAIMLIVAKLKKRNAEAAKTEASQNKPGNGNGETPC